MGSRLTFSLLLVLTLLTPTASHAAMMFGEKETIHRIEDISFQNKEGEDLFLGYKTSIQFFLGGLYITDDGYVLGVRSESDRYYDVPTGDDLKQLQADGLLPDPLPAYSIGIFDYLFGYSLWIILAVVIVIYLVGWLRKRKPPGPADGQAAA